MTISFIEKKDLKFISDLWFKSFDYNFYTMIGKNFILEYLKIAFKINKKYLFKISKNKKIVGFVIYGNDFLINRILIKKYFFLIIYTIIKKFILFKVLRAIYLINIVCYFKRKNNFSHLSKKKIELIIICINKKKIRTGLGKNLLRYSIKSIFNKEFIKKIYVKTAYPSKKTEKFYKNIGFKFYKKTFNEKWQLLSLTK